MIKSKIFLSFFICFLSGSLSTLSMEPYSFYPFILFFSYGIFEIFREDSIKLYIFKSFFFSFGWFFCGLYWIGSAFLIKSHFFYFLMPFAIIFLPCILSLFWMVSFYFSRKLCIYKGSKYVWFIFTFSLTEFLRGYVIEFPWFMPGYFFASNIYLIQGFSFIGTYTMTVVFSTLIIVPILIYENYKNILHVILVFLSPIIFLLVISFIRHEKFTSSNNKYLITYIQPNIMQKEKWESSKKEANHNVLVNLSSTIKKEENHQINLLIWPETAFLDIYPTNKISNIIEKFSFNKNRTYFMSGMISIYNKKFYNSAFFMNLTNKNTNLYHKNYLVPFGEFIPFKRFLPDIPPFSDKVNFNPGKFNEKFSFDYKKTIMPLICYEIIFGKYISSQLKQDTSLIVNITNDAWFGDTIGPHQHLLFAKIRAVEFGIPVVRVANTGISSYFDPYGNVVSKIELNNKGSRTDYLIDKLDNTVYKNYGNNIFILSLIYVWIMNIFLFSKRRNN